MDLNVLSDVHSSEVSEYSPWQEPKSVYDTKSSASGDEFNVTSAVESGMISLKSSDDYGMGLAQMAKKPGKEELKSNELQFENVGLIGRETEMQVLVAAFDRLFQTKSDDPQAQSSKKQLLLVKGNSGTGKSKLIHSLCEYASSKHSSSNKPLLCGRGKYDFNEYFSEPCAGIVAVFEDIFQQMQKYKGDSFSTEAIGSVLREELGLTVETMLRLLPGLEDILPLDNSSETMSLTPSVRSDENFNVEAAQKQLKYAFQVLTRVLCEHCTALILVLDDLQWADEASLDIIDYLVSDIQNLDALMIVGSYRSNEVNGSHSLNQRLGILRGKQSTQNFEISEVALGALSLESTNDIIMRLLQIHHREESQSLADLCFKRTKGNPHFLFEFLMMLKDEALLRFGRLSWEWDTSIIETSTKSITCLEDVLQGRMEKLSTVEQLVLQYAACLGSSFDTDILRLVWTNHGASTFKTTFTVDLESLLTGLQQQRFIESAGEKKFRWVHDKMQEAALALGDAQVSSFQFEIGTILYKTLNEIQLDRLIFDVVDLINQGNVKRRPELAMLNLRAAEKGRRVSAFASASQYVAHGIDLLPADNKWTTHRKMALRLHTLGIQLALATGDFSTMEDYSRELLSLKDCTIMEKLPVQSAHIHRLCMSSQYADAIDMSLDLLKGFGCNLIPHKKLVPIQAIASLIGAIKMTKKIVPEEFCQSHSLLCDRRQKAIVDVLSKLRYAAFMSDDTSLNALCTTRLIQITMRHGIHGESGSAFAVLGLIAKTVFGDFPTAVNLANVARLLQYRDKTSFETAGALFLAYFYLIAWTTPLEDLLQPMKIGYLAGMRVGNNNYGFWCLMMHHVSVPFHAGKPLGLIMARCPECLYQMEDYQMDDHCFHTRLMWQVCLKLSGQAPEPLTLRGGIFNDNMDVETIPFRIAMVKKAQVELWVIYSEYEQAAELALECGDSFEKVANLAFFCMAETFYRGLALYAAYRVTKLGKYKKPAQRARKKLAFWEKKGVPGVLHYHALLRAEQASAEKKYNDADLLYSKAIELAVNAGYWNCAALFNERYADFLQQAHPYFESRSDDVVFRLGEAVQYYKEWGAATKVEWIRKQKMILQER